MSKITSQSENFSQWYLDVVQMAELAENSKVKGCMVIKPYGYALWERIQQDLDKRIKAAGVQNAYFPMFIPESFLTREKDHVEGFAPECAIVTHGGGKKLAEPLVVRPTSETIMYDTFSDWVQSYRDLPLLINQWANVVRWEMRTRPFLRTTEFLWQEGHTVHQTKEEAEIEVSRALKMYEDMDRELLALPVMTGKKSEKETFAGAEYTRSTEALARDGKAIQAGTSHLLGQTFAKAFDIRFQDENGEMQYGWQTSWGVSTRMVGTLIVCHGDEKGLRLPPNIAPIQIVMVPFTRNEEDEALVFPELEKIKTELEARDIRVHIDNRDKSPGWKFNEWEIKGVPLRLEIGPRDLKESQVIIADRITSEKEKIALSDIADYVSKKLPAMQEAMYKEACDFLESHISEAASIEEMIEILDGKGGFVKAAWAGNADDEKTVQDKTKATIRIIKDGETWPSPRPCIQTGKETTQVVYFARAY